jgi:hypothetical protein
MPAAISRPSSNGTTASLWQCTTSVGTGTCSSRALTPPRSPAAGAGLDPTHEIAFADDADELAVRPDDRDAADPRGQQNMSDVLNAGIGTHRDHVPNHYVGGFHDTSPLRDQLLSPAGEFFDLNQETGTVFRGSLAPISARRVSGGSDAREACHAGSGHRLADADSEW